MDFPPKITDPIMTGGDADLCHKVLASLEQDIMTSNPRNLGEAIGKSWICLARAIQLKTLVDWDIALGVLEICVDLSVGHAGLSPLNDLLAVATTVEAFHACGYMDNDPNAALEVFILDGLQTMSDQEYIDGITKCVHIGRFLLARSQRNKAGLSRYLNQISSRLLNPTLQHRLKKFGTGNNSVKLDPVHGLSGLLSILIEGYCIIGQPKTNEIVSMLFDFLINFGPIQLNNKGQILFKFDAPMDVNKLIIDQEIPIFPKKVHMTLDGNLGTWTALKLLQHYYPESCPTTHADIIDEQIEILSRISYLMHKRLGVPAVDKYNYSLISGDSGSTVCFHRLYQVTGRTCHKQNALLWARKTGENMSTIFVPESTISGTIALENQIIIDRSLARGTGGIALVLREVLYGATLSRWHKLILP